METVEELCRRSHQRARDYKQMQVNESGRDAVFPFVTDGYRGSDHVATMFPINRDKMLWTARVAVGGFGCDRVVCTVDAFVVQGHEVHPDTKQPWQPGDMQRAFEQRRPWVSEGLKTYAIDRVEGRLHAMECKYKAKHRRIRFEEPTEIPDEFEGGLVPRVLREAMNASDMEFKMGELIRGVTGKDVGEVFGLTPRAQRVHMDMTVIRFLGRENVPVAYAVHDADDEEILEKSMSDETLNQMLGVKMNVERL